MDSESTLALTKPFVHACWKYSTCGLVFVELAELKVLSLRKERIALPRNMIAFRTIILKETPTILHLQASSLMSNANAAIKKSFHP